MSKHHTPNRDTLVSAQWLAEHLEDPHVRILDCTTHMVAQPVGPSKIISGQPDHKKSHIPGALHIDMVADLSDPQGQFPYTAIDAAKFAALMTRLQIQPSDHVVLYGQSSISSITRAWFIFYLHGHQHLSILDGGLTQWQAAGYETTSQTQQEVAIEPIIQPIVQPITASYQRRDVMVGREDVLKALHTQGLQLINALSAEQFAGKGGAHYGRPGRIPNSLNLPAKDMIDPGTGRFWDVDTLRHKVTQAGISLQVPSIHYCGGGIAATTSAFVLHRLGARDWAVYDDSLLDWSNQPEYPMVSG